MARRPRSYPSRIVWEEHRRAIVHLYLRSKLSLDGVVKHMEEHYGFHATYATQYSTALGNKTDKTRAAMYKPRFRKWKIRKYRPRKAKAAAMNELPDVDRGTSHYEDDYPTGAHSGCGLLRMNKTGPHSGRASGITSCGDLNIAMERNRQAGIAANGKHKCAGHSLFGEYARYPSAAAVMCFPRRDSRSGAIPNVVLGSTKHVFAPSSAMPSSELPFAPLQRENGFVDHTDMLAPAFPIGPHHRFLSQGHKSDEGLLTKYVACCFEAYRLHLQSNLDGAHKSFSLAQQTFDLLVKQQDESILSALNWVLMELFYRDEIELAVGILKDAQDAANRYLEQDHPILVLIDFLICQARCNVRECGPDISTLRKIYEDFGQHLGQSNRATLISGYYLAWRLTLEGPPAQNEACNILLAQQPHVDMAFGETHPQAIGNLATSAAVLRELGWPYEAAKAMSEAVVRVQEQFSSLHPYSLELKRWHAELLLDIGQYKLSEWTLIDVALNMVRVLGRIKRRTVEAVEAVEDLLCKSDFEITAFRNVAQDYEKNYS